MKFSRYIKDKFLAIVIYAVLFMFIILMLLLFKSKKELTIPIIIAVAIMGITFIFFDYFKRKKFYNFLKDNLNQLDKKYLIQEIISKPNFYDGEIFCDSLYEINKSMVEDINEYKLSINDFKEYVEMWIHEVKIPISSLVLINHNDKKENKKYSTQIAKLDNYIDQILYYVRSENAEKDFIIKETSLEKVIGSVALKNKDDLLENNIGLEVDINNLTVLTDAKWLEFIINQIINNCIKYKKENNPSIKISAQENDNNIVLSVYDNGIGIVSNDIPRIFEKSFTGENGRIKAKSTGMGLYIVKKLCVKLGHSISVKSEVNKYTEINISFYKNDYYKMK